jgi:hypothetical protein
MKQALTSIDKWLKVVVSYYSTRHHVARDRAIIAASFYAGLKAERIVALQLTNILKPYELYRNECVLSVAKTKRCKSRRVFVASKLRRQFEDCHKDIKPNPRCDVFFLFSERRVLLYQYNVLVVP